MGQYGNQPDFITTDIKSIDALNGFVSDTPSSASFLGGSLIYIGGQNGSQNLAAIPAGVVGKSTVTKLVSPGYLGSGGTGYTTDEYDVSGGSGTGLTVQITAVNGVVVSVDTITGGENGGYLNGDLVTIDATGSGNPGDDNAVFRVVAAPGLPTILDAVSFAVPPQGAWFPVPVDYVMNTGTTVTLLLAGK